MAKTQENSVTNIISYPNVQKPREIPVMERSPFKQPISNVTLILTWSLKVKTVTLTKIYLIPETYSPVKTNRLQSLSQKYTLNCLNLSTCIPKIYTELLKPSYQPQILTHPNWISQSNHNNKIKNLLCSLKIRYISWQNCQTQPNLRAHT